MRTANLANRQGTDDNQGGVVVVDIGRASEMTRGNTRGIPFEGGSPPYIYYGADDVEDLGDL
jgi:hypothetical protein